MRARRSKINVHIDAVPHTAFGWVGEQVVLGLLRRGKQVTTVAMDKDYSCSQLDPVVQLSLGAAQEDALNVVVRPLVRLAGTQLKDAVVVTIWETDAIPASAVASLNSARAVIVPSQWLKNVFVRCGVETPVHVAMYGTDSIFEPTLGTFPLRTAFLTAGRTAHGRVRKGIDLVIGAFLLAFPTETDVVLQVKTHDDCPLPELVSSRVQVLRGWWNKQTMAAWYHQGLAYVSGSAAEGWGLHQHEAMACGKPVIGVPFGGMSTFFAPPRNGYSVKGRLEKADVGGRWSVPVVESMIEAMRRVYERPVEALMTGLMAAKDVEGLTLDAMQKQHAKLILSYA